MALSTLRLGYNLVEKVQASVFGWHDKLIYALN